MVITSIRNIETGKLLQQAFTYDNSKLGNKPMVIANILNAYFESCRIEGEVCHNGLEDLAEMDSDALWGAVEKKYSADKDWLKKL